MGLVVEVSISEILRRARDRGQEVLLDPDGFDVVEAMGIAVPRRIFVRDSDAAASANLSILPGDRVVVKVVSPRILHRTDVNGVAVVPRTQVLVAAAVSEMEQRLIGREVAGFTLNEYVAHDAEPGGELLIGARWTDDFGPVVTFGPGGIHAEFLARHLTGGATILSPELSDARDVHRALAASPIVELIATPQRSRPPRVALGALEDLVGRFLRFAASFMPDPVREFEINPIIASAGRFVALDVLLKMGPPTAPADTERPVWKLARLLRPRTIGIIGVSEKLNPGRIILKNMIRDGFDPAAIRVIKPGATAIEGCRCYPDLASLPDGVDLLVVSVDAAQVPPLVEEVITAHRAETLIVIPGGMGERSGSEPLAERMREAIAITRARGDEGPLVNGGNCLGIRSRPGRYDTMFIPERKLPMARGPESPLAVVSQSGAFAIARSSKLSALNPRYLISVGNQVDLTVGDYLTFLKDDLDVRVFACYVEGFRPLDGRRWLKAATEIVRSGRTVILYRAGRTAEGAKASASHTASIAGDYAVTRELAEAAGAVVATTLNDFEDLTRLFCLLDGRPAGGRNLGAMSNAGFECVAFADNVGRFHLPVFTERTKLRIEEIVRRCRLPGIVEVRNPLDVSPIMNDEAFAESARAMLEDERVDVGVIGCVPLTGALDTLAGSPAHPEDVRRETAVASRLIRIARVTSKPFVVVVDAGALYDPMADLLEENGVPVLRSADRALRLLEVYCSRTAGALAGV